MTAPASDSRASRGASLAASELPAAEPDALAQSHALVAHIRAEIETAGGWIPFARYMELALYAPGLGYYSGGAQKFGAAGDFVTAPELTSLFGRSLAAPAGAVLAQTGGDILELGAGSGRLALDLLGELAARDCLPGRYFILELSAELRQRQRATLAEGAPRLLDRVVWLDALPDRIQGLVLGNEVLDAVPAHLLHWRDGGVFERGVAWGRGTQEGFHWVERPISADLAGLAAGLPVAGEYLTEVNPAAAALMGSLAQRLVAGALLFIDYGYPRSEYYHPQRDMGTLMVHYRHRSLADPFFLPGLADMTAHVDFSAMARAGQEAGLELLGYTSQANFLLDAGLLDLMLELEPMTPAYMGTASAVQQLLQPTEMGELFKALLLGRGVDEKTPGFRRGDRRGAL